MVVDGSLAVWLMNGLSLVSGTIIQGPGAGWNVIRVGDFNGDEKSDILLQHSDGRTAVWLMDGLNIQAAGLLVGPATGWSPLP